MTREQRRKYSEAHIRRMNIFERKYVKQLALALGSQIKSFVAELKSHGVDAAKNSLERMVVNEQIAPVLKELHVEAGVYSARKTTREINQSVKEVKAFGDNPKWINDIIRFFTTDFFTTVAGITKSMKKQILEVLTEAQKNGKGIEEIAKELEGPKLTIVRARLIARTELIKAMAHGKELGIRDSPFLTEEIWIDVHDFRTRHSHSLMGGEKITEGGRFKVPIFKKMGKVDVQIGFDLMKRPGDKTASIGNLANCRCSSVVRAVRVNGRLVRKQNIAA